MSTPGDTAQVDLALGAGLAASAQKERLPSILTVDELAALLRINRKTCYEAISRREIPGAQKIGRTIRVSRDAVLAWLAGQSRVSGSGR